MRSTKDNPHLRAMQLQSLLLWEGRLNNARLRELFGFTQIRASQWIREFREQVPSWMEWDSKTRSFHATRTAYSRWQEQGHEKEDLAASLSRYLALVGLPYATPGHISETSVWAAFPELSVPQPHVFAALTEAIRKKQGVTLTYRSMGEPVPHQRIIFPHSLVRAGRRWHARAYSVKNEDFRDYALGRVVEAKHLQTPAEQFEVDDKKWMTIVKVRLMAHPKLTQEQQDLIRFEYFNNTANRVESCRACLVSYFIQDIRAAMDVDKEQPPDYQLAVENVKEVKAWLFPS